MWRGWILAVMTIMALGLAIAGGASLVQRYVCDQRVQQQALWKQINQMEAPAAGKQ